MLDTPQQVNRLAVRDALGFPALMLLASMTGFGSLARESGLTLGVALGSTVGIWGLPGQVALAELYAAGIPLMFVVLAVSLANARFMPMAVSFIPLMRDRGRSYWWMFLLVQFLSINSWTAGLQRFGGIESGLRKRYYIVFALICMASGLVGTALGFIGVGAMPRPVALGLIFLNPLFFAVLLAGSRTRMAALALMIGAPLGPVLHLLSPDWGLLATGVTGGTAAFLINRVFESKETHG